MADTALRLIIQASGSEALQLSTGQMTVQGMPFKVERLFKNSRPRASFGISRSEWFLAVAEPGAANPWDAAHDGVMNGFGMGLTPGFSYAEPDLLQEWPSPYTTAPRMAAMAAAPPCQFQSQDTFWPLAPSFTWFLDDQFSGLRSARNAVDHSHVRIGHIDTGYSDHVIKAKNLNTDLQWNFVDGIADAHDPGIEGLLNQPGHGTGTQGILAGNVLRGLTQVNQNVNEPLGGAPDAEIVPVRVADSVLHFFTSALAQGFDYAIAPRGDVSKRCDVISLSMGGVPAKVWAEAVNRAYEAGVVIVAASGNNFSGGIIASIVYPARFDRVIAACGITADKSPYYRFGHFTEMQGNFGPASKMKTAIAAWTPNMPWAARGCPQLILENGAGTSSATPQVAASAALWLAKYNPQYDQPWKRVEAVRNALFSTGERHYEDYQKYFGNGSVKAKAALDVAPAQNLTMTPPDSVFLPILKEVIGIGIAPAQEEMFHVEACQLLQTSEALSRVLEDPDVPVKDESKIKQFMEALISEKNSSATLRRYVEGQYVLKYKTVPAGVPTPAPAPAAFAPQQKLSAPECRALRGYAFDPSLSTALATAALNEMTMQVRWEDRLKPGPVGEYIEVIDVDNSANRQEAPVDLNHPYVLARAGLDPSEGNPQFHQQMVYAVTMTTIQNFERTLGRPVLWAHKEATAPQLPEFIQRLRLYPHAMEQENAYYSPDLRALLFGYFRGTSSDPTNQLPGGMTFTCLSHDIIAHETTHAILDGMHRRFGTPTNPDMLAFHEAFADIVALFQHFTFAEVVENQIATTRSDLTTAQLLAGLAQQFGLATGMRGALRSAIGKPPNVLDYQTITEPHARGAILVATIFDAFVSIYNLRTADLVRIATGGTGIPSPGELPSDLVHRLAAEAARAAEHVLSVCVRALDYCPPVDVTFGDYLRALVTADAQFVPDDPAGYRLAFLEAFRRRAIYPLDVSTLSVESLQWQTAGEFGNSSSSRKLVQALRHYAEKCTYVTSRRRLFEINMETREKIRNLLVGIINEDAHGKETAQAFGLDGKDGFDRMDVHAVRIAQRFKSDHSPVAQAIIEVTQSTTLAIDPSDAARGSFEFIGGCTLVVDVKEPSLDYVIVKNINSAQRIQRTREFLRSQSAFGLSAYAQREPFAFLHARTQL